ncbi:MAG: hypothetical protein ACRCTQ_00350 [Brevinemataceae bacterium]
MLSSIHNLRNHFYNIILNHPYLTMMFFILSLISSVLFFNVEAVYAGDLFMYIQLAQTITNGGIVYKDAIDTKNIGFILFFTFLYSIYIKFYATMAYFFIWEAVFLTIWYFLLCVLSYHIVLLVSNNKFYGILSAFFTTLVLSQIPLGFFINQPQIALLFHLLFVYTVLKTWEKRSFIHYLIYGILLGICFIFNTPYIFLTLSIPCLIIMEKNGRFDLRNFNIIQIISKGAVAFLGFLIPMIPIALYLYKNDALLDWWYWNFTFATTGYSDNALNHYPELIRPFLAQIKPLIGIFSMTFQFVILSIYTIDSVFHAVIVDTFLVLLVMLGISQVQKKGLIQLSEKENILFAVTIFSLFSRLSLIRPYMSYNIYIFPLIFLTIPITFRLAQTVVNQKVRNVFICIFTIAFLYSFSTAIYRITSAPLFFAKLPEIKKQSWSFQDAFAFHFPRHNTFCKKLTYITQNNPDKTPTTIALNGWGQNAYNFNTKWKSIYYNVYYNMPNFQTTSSKIQTLNPEIIYISDQIFENHRDDLKYIDNNYKLVLITDKLHDIHAELLSSMVFIHKDYYNSWNLDIPEDIDSYPNPIKSLL